jgi:DNA-binding response OmpR family regulator
MSGQPGLPLLLVEDDDDLACLVEYLLRREGHVVERASDGRQAAERVRTGPRPALVILDIMLPYHDGYEILAMIRAQPGWSGVPVLTLSAKSLEKDIARALESGAADHVVKPFQTRDLIARIHGLIARSAG